MIVWSFLYTAGNMYLPYSSTESASLGQNIQSWFHNYINPIVFALFHCCIFFSPSLLPYVALKIIDDPINIPEI